eukprot:GFUD01001986.1.p1 GENE.GFUD01001986.1~~GFUD01001986.1.p1  ORF type:complete len:789 (-),score=153.17 GFUD01001986.1:31-2244(-)
MNSSGLHWNIEFSCNDSLPTGKYINVMLDDGDQTKSFRLTEARKIELLPLNVLNESSSLSIILQTRSEKIVHVVVNVTINDWKQDHSTSDDKVLEAIVDKPTSSNPSINYFYTSNLFLNYSLQSSLSVVDFMLDSTYLLVNLEQSAPYDCYVASLQNANNSVADDDQLIKRIGRWQTMLERASFIIDPAAYPKGFYLVIVEAPTIECRTPNSTETLSKEEFGTIPSDKLRITIKENSTTSDYWLGPGAVCLGYLLVFIFSICIVKYVMNQEIDEQFNETFDTHDAVGLKNLEEIILEEPSVDSQKNKIPVDAENKDGEKEGKQKRRTDKTVSELCKCTAMENPALNTAVYKRNQLHWVILIITAVFYYLPTIQMVMDSSNKYKETGNQDYCYYNFLCQKPLGKLRDFNHIFSNLGYGVLGFLFNWVVYKKESLSLALDKTNGIPRQFSIFYAMGLSLIGVGVMSSCYHVCPTSVTFQFDTTYMYLIAFFMFLKVYQNRHPDLACNAFKGFLFVGLCLCLEVASLYFYKPAFWILFTVFYMGSISSMAMYTYYSGEIPMDYMVFCRSTKMFYQGFCHWKKDKFPMNALLCPRKIFITILLLANLGLCIFFAMHNPDGLSSVLLFIFIGNLFGYILYYVLMKFYCGEKLEWHCLTFLVLCVLCMAPALYFFQRKEKSSEISPAQSRSLNRDCMDLGFDFFDQHDIWHFLGGYALFFSFMFLLTLDDDLLDVSQDIIPVF